MIPFRWNSFEVGAKISLLISEGNSAIDSWIGNAFCRLSFPNPKLNA
jgi:hypothetical protein